jgi:hypothetical protein
MADGAAGAGKAILRLFARRRIAFSLGRGKGWQEGTSAAPPRLSASFLHSLLMPAMAPRFHCWRCNSVLPFCCKSLLLLLLLVL